MAGKKSLTEQVDILFRTINSRGWRKPKTRKFNGFWRPSGQRKK